MSPPDDVTRSRAAECANCGKPIRRNGEYTWLHADSIWCDPEKHTDPGEPCASHNSARPHATPDRAATDTQALRDLAQGWRDTESRMRREHGRIAYAPLPGDSPGLRITAIQLEWAAREIERLRMEMEA